MVSAPAAGRTPANPMTTACQMPPHAAVCSPPAVVPVRSSRSRRHTRRSSSRASSGWPARASSAACTAGDSELPWAVRGP
jgi:hypothetical protein